MWVIMLLVCDSEFMVARGCIDDGGNELMEMWW